MKKEKMYSKIVFIDPMDSGSTVGYKICGDRNSDSAVYLSDCNRTINWYLYKSEDNWGASIKKLDKAIALLQEAKSVMEKKNGNQKN